MRAGKALTMHATLCSMKNLDEQKLSMMVACRGAAGQGC